MPSLFLRSLQLSDRFLDWQHLLLIIRCYIPRRAEIVIIPDDLRLVHHNADTLLLFPLGVEPVYLFDCIFRQKVLRPALLKKPRGVDEEYLLFSLAFLLISPPK